jgi:hypothetical protein
MQKTVKVNYYHMTKYGGFAATSCDMNGAAGYVLIGTGEAIIEMIPDESLVKAKITALESEKSDIRATTDKSLQELDNKIQSLLAIGVK